MTRRRGLKGARRLSLKLKRLPEEAAFEIRSVIKESLEKVAQSMRSNIRSKTGNLVQSISVRISRNGLRGRAGFLTKTARQNAFYATFLEYGTPSTLYKRGARKGKPRKPVKAYPFVLPTKQSAPKEYRPSIKEAVSRAFRKVAGIGGGDAE